MNKYDLLLWNFIRDEEDFPDIAIPFLEPGKKAVSATNGCIIITFPATLCDGDYKVNKKRNFSKILTIAEKCDPIPINVFDLLNAKPQADLTTWTEGARVQWQGAVFQWVYLKQMFDVAAFFGDGRLAVTSVPGTARGGSPLICEIGDISFGVMALEISNPGSIAIIDL